MAQTKLLFSFTVLAIVMAAAPPKPNLGGKLRLQKFIKELQLAAQYEAKDAAAVNQRSFILPSNTEPLSYNIRLSTDIHRSVFGYQGNVTINIRALEATNSSTLQSRHTIIERIDLLNPNGTLYQGDAPFLYDSELHFLVIPVIRELEAGQELIIEISYQGFIRSEQNGLFRNSYKDPVTDQETWLATTNLSPINARQVFPCYDEPRYRRPITLQIRHHRNYNAISNMPVAELTEDGEYVITVFEETPPIARPEAIQLGQADDGLNLGNVLLMNMQEFFDIPYPLPKSDQVAVPSLDLAGFEGCGLITHQENIILQFNNDLDAKHLREYRVAHETSHMYFGNLVTPTSFTYIWLSEGLALYHEYLLIKDIVRPLSTDGSFHLKVFDPVFIVDVHGLLPPLNLIAESPQDILDKFNLGTWNKAALVFRMFAEGINNATRTKAMTNYLLNNQLGNVTKEHGYDAVQEAYDEDFPGSGLNFTELMSPWFDFEGFPIVTVTRNDGRLILTQEGFRTPHNELFPIPVNYATASHPEFINFTADCWMTSSQLEISRDSAPKHWTDDDFIIVNLSKRFFFVTNYDDNLWDLIIDALNNDHDAIYYMDRSILYSNFHVFLTHDYNVSIILLMRMMESLPLELHKNVWHRGASTWALTEVRIRGTEFHQDYLNFVQNIMSQIYGRKEFNDRRTTDIVHDLSCLSGVVMETGVMNNEFDYQCNGLRAANEIVWMDFYYRVVDSSSTADRSNALKDLLCSENENLVQFYLDQVLNTTNSLLIAEREIILNTAAVQHYTSYNLLIDLIELNGVAINAITSVSNLILELALVTNNYVQAEQVLSLLQFASDDVLTEEFIVETIQPNINFYHRNADALRQWFEAKKYNSDGRLY